MDRLIAKACEILDELAHHDLDEFEIDTDGLKLSVTRESAAAPAATTAQGLPADPSLAPAALAGESSAAEHGTLGTGAGSAGGAGAPPAAPADPEAGLVPIAAPMVGMFYRSSGPDKPPFVQVGDTVEPGQPVCIIEAMKLMNLITSNVRGRISKIKVENQTPVQTGQVLILLEPA